ncbi:MAG TPA: hypothetical protein VI072_08850 [Polyangiaceae bacterium]
MSVAELERMYGRNAQVELRNPPAYQQEPVYQQEPGYQAAGYRPEPPYQADPPYYDPDAYDDPVETPVKRSPWLPVVVVMMLGIGALLGYGLYNRGLIPAQLMPSRVAMQKTESLPIERDWKGIPALPHISTDVVTSISAAKPSTPSPATEASDTSGAGAAARPAARPMTSTEDNAATLEMIRRERERLDDPGGTQQPSTTGEATEAEPSVPGYIEAETP